MKTIALALALIGAAPAFAQAAPAQSSAPDAAREAKVRELMQAMRIEETTAKTLDATMGQAMGRIADQTLAAMPQKDGITNDPEFKAILKRNLENMSARMTAEMKAVMPEIIQAMSNIYARNFSTAELADMVTFYRTPTGQALIERLPEVSRQSVEATQAIMLPRIAKIVPEMSARMKADIVDWAKAHPETDSKR